MFLKCCTIALFAASYLLPCASIDLGTGKQPFKNKDAIKQNDTSYNALTANEKSKYKLMISMGGLIQSKCPDSTLHYKVNVTLKNNSTDTLRYIDWSCSSEIWEIDNNGVNVLPPFLVDNCGDCDKNIISIYEVSPGHEQQLYIYVVRTKHNAKGTPFRIGMILQRVLRKEDYWLYMNYFIGGSNRLSGQKMNIVWSNSIQIP